MDRIKVLAPIALAAWALLGEQGARLAGFEVPAISLRWAIVAAAVGFFITPRRDRAPLGRGRAIAAVAMASAFVVLSVWRSAVLDPPLGLAVGINNKDGVRREVIADSLQLPGRRELRRLTGEATQRALRDRGRSRNPAERALPIRARMRRYVRHTARRHPAC